MEIWELYSDQNVKQIKPLLFFYLFSHPLTRFQPCTQIIILTKRWRVCWDAFLTLLKEFICIMDIW